MTTIENICAYCSIDQSLTEMSRIFDESSIDYNKLWLNLATIKQNPIYNQSGIVLLDTKRNYRSFPVSLVNNTNDRTLDKIAQTKSGRTFLTQLYLDLSSISLKTDDTETAEWASFAMIRVLAAIQRKLVPLERYNNQIATGNVPIFPFQVNRVFAASSLPNADLRASLIEEGKVKISYKSSPLIPQAPSRNPAVVTHPQFLPCDSMFTVYKSYFEALPDAVCDGRNSGIELAEDLLIGVKIGPRIIYTLPLYLVHLSNLSDSIRSSNQLTQLFFAATSFLIFAAIESVASPNLSASFLSKVLTYIDVSVTVLGGGLIIADAQREIIYQQNPEQGEIYGRVLDGIHSALSVYAVTRLVTMPIVDSYRVSLKAQPSLADTATKTEALITNSIPSQATTSSLKKVSSYRQNYKNYLQARGLNPLPKEYDVHHAIPQKLMTDPQFKDFDFHDVSNLRGVQGSRASTNIHNQITQKWRQFLNQNPTATRVEIEKFSRQIDTEFKSYYWENPSATQ